MNSDLRSSCRINLCKNVFAYIHVTVNNLASVNKKMVNFESCKNFGFQVFVNDKSAVADLTAAFCVERSSVKNNIYVAFAFNCCKNFCLAAINKITHKFSRADLFFDFCVLNITCYGNFLCCCLCSVFLFLHCSLESFLINF